jgi:hypothetical protein
MNYLPCPPPQRTEKKVKNYEHVNQAGDITGTAINETEKFTLSVFVNFSV